MARLPNPNESLRSALSDQLENGRLRCPYCGQLATPEKLYGATARVANEAESILGIVETHPAYSLTVAVCAGCGQQSVFVRQWTRSKSRSGDSEEETRWHKRLYPLGRATKDLPHTPEVHLKPYRAACATLEVSAEASACMSRRCIQGILRDKGYGHKDLVKQIEALLSEDDPKKCLPADLHACVDAVRNFGNFGAHPINDLTTLQIIDIEPGEAEWCIEIAEQLMEHYFERPKLIVIHGSGIESIPGVAAGGDLVGYGLGHCTTSKADPQRRDHLKTRRVAQPPSGKLLNKINALDTIW